MALNKTQLIKDIEDFSKNGDVAKLADAIENYIKSGQLIINMEPFKVTTPAGPGATIPIPVVVDLKTSLN